MSGHSFTERATYLMLEGQARGKNVSLWLYCYSLPLQESGFCRGLTAAAHLWRLNLELH